MKFSPLVIVALVFTLSSANAQIYSTAGSIAGTPGSTSNVGIGSSSGNMPQAPLHLSFTDNNFSNDIGFLIERTGGTQGSSTSRGVAIAFKDGNNPTLIAGIAAIRQTPSSNYNGDLAFFTNATGAASNALTFASMSERMRIKANGYVGIGTTTPNTLLDLNNLKIGVIGDLPAEGSITEVNWGNYILGDIYGAQRLRLGVSNDQYTRAEIFIDNSNRADGTIHLKTASTTGGAQTRLFVDGTGNVGIGTTLPDTKLAVKGTIHAQEVKVDVSVPGPDYVFEADYDLLPLTDLEKYLAKNKHLPEVPSAAQMAEDGMNVAEMNLLLLKKVEEMTLYMIEMKKEIETLKANQK